MALLLLFMSSVNTGEIPRCVWGSCPGKRLPPIEQRDGPELKELHHSNEFQNSGYELVVGMK